MAHVNTTGSNIRCGLGLAMASIAGASRPTSLSEATSSASLVDQTPLQADAYYATAVLDVNEVPAGSASTAQRARTPKRTRAALPWYCACRPIATAATTGAPTARQITSPGRTPSRVARQTCRPRRPLSRRLTTNVALSAAAATTSTHHHAVRDVTFSANNVANRRVNNLLVLYLKVTTAATRLQSSSRG